MRICLFSDVHGNFDALSAMFEAEDKKTDLYIFVGDIFGYFYDQVRVIDLLRAKDNLIAVRGNHDDNFLKYPMDEVFIERYGSSYCARLSDPQQAFLASLPVTAQAVVCGKKIRIMHGGPEDALMQRVFPDTILDVRLLREDDDVLILGHTHYRMEVTIGHTKVINPGSLGQPRDGLGFSYCIFWPEDLSCRFKNIRVAVGKLLQKVRQTDGDRHVYSYLKRKYGEAHL